MKHFTVTVIQDRGAEFDVQVYSSRFSGAKAACLAYALACRAAMLEPSSLHALQAWCRDAQVNSRLSTNNNLRSVTVCLTRSL